MIPEIQRVAEPVGKVLDEVLETAHERATALDSEAAALVDVISELIAAGGKRLRPALLYWGHVAARGELNEEMCWRAGAALELVHAFALIHDDVMDRAQLRRGQKTAHVKFAENHSLHAWVGDPDHFGDSAAILAGDLALVLADEALGDVRPAPRRLYDLMRHELCIGQYLDIVNSASGETDIERAFRVEELKSSHYSVLFPLEFGAVLGEALDSSVHELHELGLPLARAFQLNDDILSVFGDPVITGKSNLSDLRDGKRTPLFLHAMEGADHEQRAILKRAGAKHFTEEDADAIRKVIEATGARAAIEQEIDDALSEMSAVAAASNLEPEACRPILRIAESVLKSPEPQGTVTA